MVDMNDDLGQMRLTEEKLSSSRRKGTTESMSSLTGGSDGVRSPTTTCTLIAMCLLVSMVTSIGFTVAALMVMIQTGRLTVTAGSGSAPTSARVCVPCEALRISGDPLDDMTGGFDQDTGLCCANNAAQTRTIISAVSHTFSYLTVRFGSSMIVYSCSLTGRHVSVPSQSHLSRLSFEIVL